MKSPHSFIVRPIGNRRYDNIKKIGSIDFITSTSEEDHTVSNRYAEVVETPINYTGEVKKGDTLLVHHNVFKFYNDMKGKRKSGKSFFKEDLFFIDPLIGTLIYSNAQLKKKGLKEGDVVSYQPDSEYAFKVDGETLYRMFTNNITLKLNG